MRLEKQPDELGYLAGVGSIDDAPAPRFEMLAEQPVPTQNTHGLPPAVMASIIAAHEAEDAPDPNELDQRRYEMERAIIAAAKDKFLTEMSHLLVKVYAAVDARPSLDTHDTLLAARFIVEHGVNVDSACLAASRIRSGKAIRMSKAEVLAFKS